MKECYLEFVVNKKQDLQDKKSLSFQSISTNIKPNKNLIELLEKLDEEKKINDEIEKQHLQLLKDVEHYVSLIMFDKACNILFNNKKVYDVFFSGNPNLKKFTAFQNKLYNLFIEYSKKNEGFVDKSNNFAKIYVKLEDKGRQIIKFQKQIECDLLNFMKLIYETDYYIHWFPFVSISKTLSTIGVGQKIVFLENNLPLISNRDFLICGFGINQAKENGKVFVLSKSIDDEPDFKEYHSYKHNNKNIRGLINIFGWELTRVGLNKYIIDGVISIDPKVDFVPEFLLNLALKKLTVDIFNEMLKLIPDYENSKVCNKYPTEIDKKVYNILINEIEELNKQK